MSTHAEISVIPISSEAGTSMSKQVAAAYEAIRGVDGIRATLTPLGTQIEAESLDRVVQALTAAHAAVRKSGAERIISTIRIDERFDKNQSLEDKVESVKRALRQ